MTDRGSSDAPLFSRDQLMGGLPARRAASAVYAIENRTARLVARSRRAVERYVSERAAAQEETAFLAALAEGRDPPLRPAITDIEAHAEEWASLVAADSSLRAAVARQLAAKYRFRRGDVPRLRAALALDDGSVGDAFLRLFKEPIESIYSSLTPRERLRWRLARARDRLERLSPAWVAFALTLTETVGAGVLALPIAFAGVGIVPALGLLLVFGLVNLVTIVALVESINRNGSIRYGSAYFGRLVDDYLGPPGRAVQSLLLFVINALCVVSYAIGVGSTFGSLSSTPPLLWIGILGLVTFAVIRRGSLDATVATAMLIGFVNIGLLTAIALLGLSHFDPARLAPAAVSGVGALALVFGVVLTAYYGHTSVGTAAKLVLTRDPTGRSLLRGAVGAMTVAMILYGLVVVTINGAVPASDLAGIAGTAIEPLAAVVGPSVSVLGAAFVVLAMGQATVLCSLALFSQTLEVLSARGGSGRERFSSPRTLRLLALVPVLLTFLLVPVLLVTGNGTFTGLIAVLGTVATPILAGVIPMLMLLAARRRGEFAPAFAPRVLGLPIVVVAVAGLYTCGLLVQGWLVSDDPLMRIGTLLATLAVIYIAIRAVRDGAFRPRAVLELRAEDAGRVRYTLVDAGHAMPLQATVESTSAGQPGWLDRNAVAAGAQLALPATDELLVWSHRVTDDGDSLPFALAITTPEDGQLELVAGRVTVPPRNGLTRILSVRRAAAETSTGRAADRTDLAGIARIPTPVAPGKASS